MSNINIGDTVKIVADLYYSNFEIGKKGVVIDTKNVGTSFEIIEVSFDDAPDLYIKPWELEIIRRGKIKKQESVSLFSLLGKISPKTNWARDAINILKQVKNEDMLQLTLQIPQSAVNKAEMFIDYQSESIGLTVLHDSKTIWLFDWKRRIGII